MYVLTALLQHIIIYKSRKINYKRRPSVDESIDIPKFYWNRSSSFWVYIMEDKQRNVYLYYVYRYISVSLALRIAKETK